MDDLSGSAYDDLFELLRIIGGVTVDKDERGFSLIEVALILVIMGIVGVAAIPSIVQARRQEVRQVAKEICLDLTEQKMNDGIYTNIYVGEETVSTSRSTSVSNVMGDLSSIHYMNISRNNTYLYDGYELTLNTSRNGYTIDRGGNQLLSRIGEGKVKLSIAGTNGSFNGNVSKLIYSQGKMTNNLEGATPYSTVSVQVKNNQAECILVYIPTTGYYSISS